MGLVECLRCCVALGGAASWDGVVVENQYDCKTKHAPRPTPHAPHFHTVNKFSKRMQNYFFDAMESHTPRFEKYLCSDT